MIRLAFLRHGVTGWNREGRIQGRTDIPLDPEGRDRLASLTLPEPWRDATLHASPLSRAVETATLLVPGRPVHTDPRLIEMDWGAWEGLRGLDLRAAPASGYRDLEHWGWDFRPPGGESPADVRERLTGWLENLLPLSPQTQSPLPPGERVRVRGSRGKDSRDSHATHPPHPDPLPGGERETHLVVTHIGVIRVALALAWGWDFRGPPPVPVKRHRLYAMTLTADGTLHPAGRKEGERLS
ncbi:histidine phosphatase family protein [Azospirillum sp. YIM B02556]|uniref:Histidine phosphatase family protein n=1 Tax=Azospirillum endophyticum TaxID=2800326 RepID=A0ABS1F612_9PROT|nr:histidine phosphatase family protein [Azospirillum endophyticum]MBK1838884.1 histidine phosphatase family protein [Azospirillum endophyticum]